MKSSKTNSARTSEADISSTASSLRPARRIGWLLVASIILLIALPLSRRFLIRPEPPTARTPSDGARSTSLDTSLQSALQFERNRYYMAALEQLESARREGAPDSATAGPMGRCLTRLARYEEARAELEKAVRFAPDSIEAVIDLADLLAKIGQPEEATRHLRGFLDRHRSLADAPAPDHRTEIEALMGAFENLGERESAVRLAQALIRVAPKVPDGYAVAGKNLLLLGRPRESAEYLRRAIELAPDFADAHYLYGVALSHLPGSQKEALEHWKRTVTLNPQAARALFRIGREFARRRDWLQAANAYMMAGSLGREPIRGYQLAAEAWLRLRRLPQVTYCQAVAAAAAGNYKTALQRFLTLSTSSHPIWRKRGLEGAAETYRLLGRYKDYLVYARKAAFTHTANDYLQISNAYLLLNDHPNRIAYLKRALAADPGLAGRVHRELGALAERGNRLDEAEREYEAAIAADPDNPWYYRSLARVFLARRNSGGRLARAIQMAERAVALAPDSPEDFHQLGIAHAAAGNLEKAVQAFQHAIDLQPDYQPSYLYLARTLIRKGDRARGERMMQLYRHYEARSLEKQRLANRVRQNPRDASALTALANLHAGEGDYARAADLLRRARRLAPSDARTRSGLTRMENLLARAVVMPD